MRVAVNVEQLLYPSPGGIGRYTERLVTLLPRLFPDDEVIPLCARHPLAEIDAAMREHGLTTHPRRSPLPRPILYECWHRLGFPPAGWPAGGGPRPDVVHAPSVAVPPRRGTPLVVTVHDAAPLLYPEAFSRHGLRFHLGGLEAAARRADLVIAVSEAAADEISSLTKIATDRIRVVHNGVNQYRWTEGSTAATMRRIGLGGKRYVLWVGSMEPRKNVPTLAAAMAELHRRAAGGAAAEVPLLVLAGYAGWGVDTTIPDEDRRWLGGSVRALGRVSDNTLRALYAGAAVFALPSLHEGFGLPLLEAMVQGTPVVCSDIPSLREIGGDVPVYVDPLQPTEWADALARVLGEDDDARRRRADAGRARAAGFTWEDCVRETHEIYLDAARRR